MNVREVLQLMNAGGVSVSIDGDDLVLHASRPADPALQELVRRHKAEILRLHHDHAAWTEEDWNALFDERAGIMEFDGGLARVDAETRAAEDVNILRSLARSGDG